MNRLYAKGRSRDIVLFVALAILTSSMAIMSAHGAVGSAEQPIAPDSGNEEWISDSGAFRSWENHGYDFRALAGEDGFVDVILRPRCGHIDSVFLSELRSTMESSASVSPGRESVGADTHTPIAESFGVALDALALNVSLDTLDELLSQDQIYEVYPDIVVYATLDQSVSQIGADQLWEEIDAYGRPVRGEGIVVSVIDTGVDYMHPDLGGGIGPAYKVIGGYDFCNDDSDPMDDNGHGTHVAGIVAADGDIHGVAPSASIMAYKALGPTGSGFMSDVILAISASMDPNGDGNTDDHVDIITMSLGAAGDADDPVCIAVDNAVQAGIVVIVSAGNDGPSMGTVSSPGLAPSALTVGAVDENGALADFSSRGAGTELIVKPEISAPGVGILSTVPYGGTQFSSSTGYLSLSGTSMAAPHVTGAAALLLQQHPSWNPLQVKSALVDYAAASTDSLWYAGSGNLWVPAAADATVFADMAVLNYGLASGPSLSFTVTNVGAGATFQASVFDFHSIATDGSESVRIWTNYTDLDPSSVTIQAGASETLSVAVALPPSFLGGYYEGYVSLSDGIRQLRMPVGFAAVSILNVHAIDMKGREIIDSYGGVFIYSYPDAIFSDSVRAIARAAPPASFILDSGEYAVHASGHQLLYMYSDPYLLSQVVNVAPVEEVDVYLQMSSARQMVLDLQTDDGCPIYVKNFRLYALYAGEVNVSFHITSSDNSVAGSAFFGLPVSRTIYVSDTSAAVGFSITGYSYSRGMWDFMSRNWNHWYEYRTGTSTSFAVTATADLEYLLAWEFDGVDAATPLSLTLEPGCFSTYIQKLDVPGTITDVWAGGGNHLSMGATSTFYVRRDTSSSINVAFSGMTRTTFVQGVFSHRYLPGSIYSTAFDLELYSPDLSHVLPVTGFPGVYLPDRGYLDPLPASESSHSVGLGPFYPAVRTMNTINTFSMMHPVLCDQAGARVAGWDAPSLRLLRNGVAIGLMDLIEYQARPSAVRTVALGSSGTYVAEIGYHPGTMVCTDTIIRLGFTNPASDMNPPTIEALAMPQKFVPGEQLPVQVSVADDVCVDSAELMWRSHGTTSWDTVDLWESLPGVYSGTIDTSPGQSALDILLRVYDASGNFIEYEASNASLAQTPVLFELSASASEFEYRNGESVVTLSGRLTDMIGNPLSAFASVPIDLFVGDRKVGLLLDEYMIEGSHVHNGTIRFDWHFNPVELFTGPFETVNIDAVFDLGSYQQVSHRLVFSSIEWTGSPPSIALVSPANQSLIRAGTMISLSLSDDGPFTAEAYLDGTSLGQLASPWQVSTAMWSDGRHNLRIVATDNEGAVSEATFVFDVDAFIPTVHILYPSAGFRIPVGSVLQASVYDTYLIGATYRMDGGESLALPYPYSIDLTGWSLGVHTVEISAEDGVGNIATESVSFEIASSTVVVRILSPADGSFVKSGVPIEIEVDGAEPTSVRWCEGVVWHDLGATRSISTSEWSEGVHNIIINATDSLNGFDQISFTLTIDDTSPRITLVSPDNGSFVSKTDVLRVSVSDVNFASVSWTLWGITWRSVNPDVLIGLGSCPADGYFSVKITALDLADNQVQVSFTFAMDSLPPSVSVANLASGGALRPGIMLDVVVTDSFLESVSCSLDSLEFSPLEYPYDIDTSALLSGFHTLEIIAIDATEKTTSLEMPFYIDATLPQVTIGPETTFVEGSAHIITAEASDDFAVDVVTLHCEMQSGGFSSVPMVWDGSRYVATVPESCLWDGMSVFVIAVDEAGNLAGTPHIVLRSTPLAAADDVGEAEPPFAWLRSGLLSSSGFTYLALVGTIATVLLAGIVLSLGAKRGEESERVDARGRRRPEERDIRALDAPYTEPMVGAMHPTLLAGGRGIGGEALMNKKEETRPEPLEPSEAGTEQRPRKASLIEAIPETPVMVSAGVDNEADDIDYGELIERELIIPGREGSVYREREDEPPRTDFELLREIMDDLGRLGHKKPPF